MKTLRLLFIIFVATTVNAQHADWATFYKGADNLPYLKNFTAIDTENNIYTIGRMGSQIGIQLYSSVTQEFENYGSSRNFLYKTSPQGEILWLVPFGTLYQIDTNIKDMAIGPDENIYIIGNFYKNLTLGQTGNSVTLMASKRNEFVAKISPEGHVLAAHQLKKSGPSFQGLSAIYFDNNNHLNFLCNFDGETDFGLKDESHFVDSNAPLIAKYNLDFDFISAYPLDFTVVHEIKRIDTGKIITTGLVLDSIQLNNTNYFGFSQLVLSCYSTDYELEWSIHCTKQDNIGTRPEFTNFITNSIGEVYFTGFHDNPITFHANDNNYELNGQNDNQTSGFIGKISYSGNIEWVKDIYYESGPIIGQTLIFDNNSNILLGGHAILTNDSIIGSYSSIRRSILSTFNLDGELQNSFFIDGKEFHPNKRNTILSIEKASDGSLYVHGEFEGNMKFNKDDPDATFEINNTGMARFIAKLNSAPVGIASAPHRMPIHLYPNPTTDILYIESPVEVKQMEVYSAEGKLLHSYKATLGNTVHTLNTTGLKAGMYYLRLTANDGSTGTEKFMIYK